MLFVSLACYTYLYVVYVEQVNLAFVDNSGEM